MQFIDDLVDGLLALMESEYDKPVNLGNPHEYTIEVRTFPDNSAETAKAKSPLPNLEFDILPELI